VEVETFVDAGAIGAEYFEKPYFLVPGKKAEKGYVLLRETLKRTGKIGIARVVIRTREYLSAVMPKGDSLLLMLLRYPQELVDAGEYSIPEGKPADYRVSAKEIDMAQQLIESMSDDWQPDSFRDEFRDRLRKVIEKRMKSKGVVITPEEETTDENASTNVVDFMALLQQSLKSKRRTPAKGSDEERPPRRAKAPRKSAKKAAAKKSTRKRSSG
jgi:DNA end-binding protein Ku